MKYSYTAVFTPNEDGTKYYIRIPDLPSCITTGHSIEDSIEQITDAASGWLVVAEDEGLSIAPPTPQNQIPHRENDILSIISIDTLAYRAATDSHAVRKNVSIPAWMSNLADKKGINCSQVLQDGLKAIFNTA